MSILSGKQEITPQWLEKQGFCKSSWGRPGQQPGYIVWEKVFTMEYNSYDCSIIYFPDDFKGYVTSIGGDGKAAHHVLFLTRSYKNAHHKCNDIFDFLSYVDCTLKKIEEDPWEYL